MKAFVSLHTAIPQGQIDHEVNYRGYRRVPVDFDDSFGATPINIAFAPIEEDSSEVVTYIAVGTAEKGQGEVLLRVPALPHIPILAMLERRDPKWWIAQGIPPERADEMVRREGKIAPRICISNTAHVELPAHLNPIARVVHHLVFAGLLNPADLHPRLYEAINDALQNAGVAPIPVARGGAAKMDIDLNNITPSDWGNA